MDIGIVSGIGIGNVNVNSNARGGWNGHGIGN